MIRVASPESTLNLCAAKLFTPHLSDVFFLGDSVGCFGGPEVSVAYVSTAEVWVDSAVDWTLYGLNKAGCREVHLSTFGKREENICNITLSPIIHESYCLFNKGSS